MAFLCRQPNQRILILTLETGTRSTYLTSTLLVMSLPQPEADVAKTTPVLVTLLSLIPSFSLVCIYRMYRRYTGQDLSDPGYAPTSSYSEEEVEEGEEEGEEDGEEEEDREGDGEGKREKANGKCLSHVELVDEKETCI